MHPREAPEAELTAWGLPGAKALRPGQDWSRVEPEQNFLESPCLSFCTSQYLRGLRQVPPIARGTSIQKPGFSFPATVLKPCLPSLSSPFCVHLLHFMAVLQLSSGCHTPRHALSQSRALGEAGLGEKWNVGWELTPRPQYGGPGVLEDGCGAG